MSEDAKSTEITLSKPSIFEIVAHQAVAAVFRPACQYVIRVLAQKYPENFAVILKYADEIYLLCDLVLQRHYLSCYNASLSENFYYLKRVNVVNGLANRLSNKFQYLSLIALVLWPYIKLKVDQTFERLRDRIIREENDDSSRRSRLTLALLKIYPYIHFTIQSISAVYQLGYTLKLLNYHSPVFHLLKMQLVRASSDDLLGFHKDVFGGSKSFWQLCLSMPSFLLDKIIKFVTVIMPAIIFFLQFVEWWYSTDHEMTSSVMNLPIPPPPKMPKVSESGCGLPPHPLQCPLCHKVHSNMASLVSSGFVFCYPCIHQFVTEHGCCPVTNIPSSLDQILRIYSLRDS